MVIQIEWILAIVYLFSGLNDVFMDLVFYVKPLFRLLAQGRENPRATEEELYDLEEQPIAILIPAWDESSVVGKMLESTHDRLEYKNYDIFVGTYPNDEATQMEVARVAHKRPRIHRVVCPNPGPTSKADCLNWIVEAIKLKESETGRRYAIFTLQDAEDVVHPLALKVFNRFIPEYDLIQLPVIPYERALYQLTGGTYLDEFAEVHLKNLDARLAIGGMVPSAGVGTGFGREACDELAAQTNHQLFPPVSLTEDYDFSFRLFRNGRKSGLARVWVDSYDTKGHTFRDLIAIREYFPAVFGDAVRQKQRWMLGITFQGWEKLGWGRGLREKYMLARDRMGPASSVLNMVALFLMFRVAMLVGWAVVHHEAWNAEKAFLALPHTLQVLLEINSLFLANRIAQRAYCVAKIASKRQMFLVPVRLIWGNVIDFYCTVHAVRRYVYSRFSGKPLKWLKTAHEYPNMETLLTRHRPIGDILLEHRLITPEQLREALDKQRGPAGGMRILGEILVSMLAITEEQLEATLAAQAEAKEASRAVVRAVDPAPLNAWMDDKRERSEKPRNAKESRMRKRLLAAAEAERRRLAAELPIPLAALQQHEDVLPPPFGAPLLQGNAPAVLQGLAAPVVEAVAEPPMQAVVEPLYAVAESAMQAAVEPIRPTSNAPSAVPVVDAEWMPVPVAQVRQDSGRRAATPAIPIDSHVPAMAADATPEEHALAAAAAMMRAALPLARSKPSTSQRRFFMLHTIASKWNSPFPAKRFVVAVGTRPEAIKLAPLIRELQGRIGTQSGPEEVFVCATGQHEAMVEDALAQFGVTVDMNLSLMTPGQSLAAVSARILSRFEAVLHEVKPDWVIVQGDTVTTSMASLAAFYAGIRVAHVEAGLRTNNLQHPFPEEFNRRMVSIFASMHFAATPWGKQNLLREGVDERSVVVTGNTGIDALRSNCERLGIDPAYERPLGAGPLRVLVTAHRRENLEEGIGNICTAIQTLSAQHPDEFLFLWPLHPNPKVRDRVRERLSGMKNVILRPAAQYDELLGYIQQSDVVLTDSGGLQEEAPSFRKPVLILREKTERPEGVDAGVAWLVGTEPAKIQEALLGLADRIADLRVVSQPGNPYGDGLASARIADFFAGYPVREFEGRPRAYSRRSRYSEQREFAAAL